MSNNKVRIAINGVEITGVRRFSSHVRRAGKGGARVYSDADFDLLALVALDIKRIAYLPPSMFLQTVHIRPPGATGGKQFDDYQFDAAMRGMS